MMRGMKMVFGNPKTKNTPKPQRVTFGNLLGVNGICGLGTQKYSNALSDSDGPNLYSKFASHGRNFHNLKRGVTDPDLGHGRRQWYAGHVVL